MKQHHYLTAAQFKAETKAIAAHSGNKIKPGVLQHAIAKNHGFSTQQAFCKHLDSFSNLDLFTYYDIEAKQLVMEMEPGSAYAADTPQLTEYFSMPDKVDEVIQRLSAHSRWDYHEFFEDMKSMAMCFFEYAYKDNLEAFEEFRAEINPDPFTEWVHIESNIACKQMHNAFARKAYTQSMMSMLHEFTNDMHITTSDVSPVHEFLEVTPETYLKLAEYLLDYAGDCLHIFFARPDRSHAVGLGNPKSIETINVGKCKSFDEARKMVATSIDHCKIHFLIDTITGTEIAKQRLKDTPK